MRYFTLICSCIIVLNCSAQTKKGFLNLGLEYNFNLQGHMLGAQSEMAIRRNSHHDAFNNPHHTINARVGGRYINNTPVSELYSSEKALGYGMSLGYRYYRSRDWRMGYAGLYLGIRSDLWMLQTKWENKLSSPPEGSFSAMQLIPKLELGYKFQIGKNAYILGSSIGQELQLSGDEMSNNLIYEAQLIIAKKFF